MARAISDPEERERRQRDPVAYDATERLCDAGDELRAALDVRVNETALRLYRSDPIPARPPERLSEARERLDAAEAAWTAALSNADALLQRRREGGEDEDYVTCPECGCENYDTSEDDPAPGVWTCTCAECRQKWEVKV